MKKYTKGHLIIEILRRMEVIVVWRGVSMNRHGLHCISLTFIIVRGAFT